MKKTAILASAVALVLSGTAAADVNLYGSLNTNLVSEGGLNISDGSSRWGVKGTHDTGNGLTGIYRMELKVNTENGGDAGTERLAFVGLKGGFGRVSIGQQWSPYYSSVLSSSDPFANGGLRVNNVHYRLSNSLNYAFGGGNFSGEVALIINDSANTDVAASAAVPAVTTTDSGGDTVTLVPAVPAVPESDVIANDIDRIVLGLNFKAGDIKIGVGYDKATQLDEATLGFSVGGKAGSLGWVVLYQLHKDGGTGGSDSTIAAGKRANGDNDLAITVTFNDIKAQFATNEPGDTGITVMYTQKLAKKVSMKYTLSTVAYDEAKNLEDPDPRLAARLSVGF